MQTLELIMLVAISLAILFFVLLVTYVGSRIRTGKKIVALRAKPKNKKEVRRWRREKNSLEALKRTQLKSIIILFSLLLVTSGIAGYSKYYQLTNMTAADTETIVTGYYLMSKVGEQLDERLNNSIDSKKLNENVHNLSVRMASFASKRANNSGSSEGQQLLNRYYAQVGQLGVNLASEQFADTADEPTTLATYKLDIEKAQKNQKKVLDFYKVDEGSLKEKK